MPTHATLGGFGVPAMYENCERLHIWYTFGYSIKYLLKEASDDMLAAAEKQYAQTHEKQRLFTVLDYQDKTWNQSRPVIIKAECHAAGTNRRAVVTNRRGAMILPQGVYDKYFQRGESENRNKELKIDLCAGRLSDHRFMANLFRLLLHSTALNLMIRLRRSWPETTPDAEPKSEPDAEPDAPADSQQSASVTESGRVVSGLTELRRAQPATWRLRVIKVAAEIVISCRRVLIRLSSAWPHLPTWRAVLQNVQRL